MQKKRKTVYLRSVRRLLVTANVVPSSSILVTLMKEALSSSETSVLTRATLPRSVGGKREVRKRELQAGIGSQKWENPYRIARRHSYRRHEP
jgi:hypothetical protein